jgi:hypothetical protein
VGHNSISDNPIQRSLCSDDSHRSVETLVRYLSDRRPKVGGALDALHINPSQSHQIAFLSETSADDLFALPNAPLSSLTQEQLLRFAQIVDTALFKSYLIIRPGLLGPLCRVPNWCEVTEVEEELRAREVGSSVYGLFSFGTDKFSEICRTNLPLQWEENARQSSRASATVRSNVILDAKALTLFAA